VIGDYDAPRTRLPGAGGAPEIATGCDRVIVVAPHSPRTFVARLDFLTTRAAPEAVITDLGVLEPRAGGELALTEIHPGVEVDAVRAATGWDLQVAADLRPTPPATAEELAALRELAGR
jgi:glutaconate CoA-transferase subunit B